MRSTQLFFVFEDGGRDHEQRMQAACISWKKRRRWSLESPEGIQYYPNLDFSPVRLISDF